jgi:hypothetical protein
VSVIEVKFKLSNKSDWQAIQQSISLLKWARADGSSIRYRVIIEEDVLPRTTPQNALQHVWYTLAANQLQDDTEEGYRAYCKLTMGVPILRRDSEEFRAAYDRVIRPLPYELKLEAMKHPLDFPITRLMTKRQYNEFADAVYIHLTGLGADLERRAA